MVLPLSGFLTVDFNKDAVILIELGQRPTTTGYAFVL